MHLDARGKSAPYAIADEVSQHSLTLGDYLTSAQRQGWHYALFSLRYSVLRLIPRWRAAAEMLPS